MTEEVVTTIAFSLAPIGAFTILLFGYNCLMAPIRIARETKLTYQKQEAELQEKIQRLGRDINEDVVKLFFDDNLQFCREDIPAHISKKQWIASKVLYRAGVFTTGKKTIENVEVYLIELEEWENGGPNKATPGVLSPMHSKKDSTSAFDVNPSDIPLRYVDIFKWRRDKSEIEICYHNNLVGIVQPIPDKFEIHGDHYLTLHVTGKDIPTQEFLFLIKIDEQGDLIFRLEKTKYIQGNGNGY